MVTVTIINKMCLLLIVMYFNNIHHYFFAENRNAVCCYQLPEIRDTMYSTEIWSMCLQQVRLNLRHTVWWWWKWLKDGKDNIDYLQCHQLTECTKFTVFHRTVDCQLFCN